MRIDLALAHSWPGAQWALLGTDYVGLEWLDESPKPTEAEIAAAWNAMPAPVPASVTPRQARLVLLGANLLDTVEAAIAAGPREDQITWEFAVDVRRDYPMIENMRVALGLTSAQVDDLFRTAATL